MKTVKEILGENQALRGALRVLTGKTNSGKRAIYISGNPEGFRLLADILRHKPMPSAAGEASPGIFSSWSAERDRSTSRRTIRSMSSKFIAKIIFPRSTRRPPREGTRLPRETAEDPSRWRNRLGVMARLRLPNGFEPVEFRGSYEQCPDWNYRLRQHWQDLLWRPQKVRKSRNLGVCGHRDVARGGPRPGRSKFQERARSGNCSPTLESRSWST